MCVCREHLVGVLLLHSSGRCGGVALLRYDAILRCKKTKGVCWWWGMWEVEGGVDMMIGGAEFKQFGG